MGNYTTYGTKQYIFSLSYTTMVQIALSAGMDNRLFSYTGTGSANCNFTATMYEREHGITLTDIYVQTCFDVTILAIGY